MNDFCIVDNSYMDDINIDSSYEKLRTNRVTREGEVTIIVQAYDRIEKTKECVVNLLKNTTYEGYELWLLDNGSIFNDVMEYYESVDYKYKKRVRFEKNQFGVLSLNYLFSRVETEYVVVVLNDIIVTPNWLENLMICADSNKTAGMIVPASTNISNRQQINLLNGNESIEEINEIGRTYNVSNPLLWEERIMLIPTVALYRTAVFDLVGKYDTGFLFDYGDNDFSFRVRRAGFELIYAGDTFVRHNHPHNLASMTPEKRENVIKLSLKGRDTFMKKHNGIDGLEDTGNTIERYFEKWNVDNEKRLNLLCIDPRCGTPALEMKNHVRKNSDIEPSVTTYCSDFRYEQDLVSISDRTMIHEVEEMKLYLQYDEFDAVVLPEPLNKYKNPRLVFDSIFDVCKKNGYILFCVENEGDIRNFLYCIGVIENRNRNNRSVIYIEDVIDWCGEKKLRDINVLVEMHPLDNNTIRVIDEIMGNITIAKGDANMTVKIKKYWISILT